MSVTLIPDNSKVAAPLTQVLVNAISLVGQTGGDSIISYSEPCRIEPPTVVDAELALQDFMPKLLSATCNLFSCYFVASATRSLDVNSYRLLRSIDHLRPNRSIESATMEFLNDSNARLEKPYSVNVDSYVQGKVVTMVGESLAGIDYLPRGSHVMAMESAQKPKEKIAFRVATGQDHKEFNRRVEAGVKKAVDDAVKKETTSIQQRAAAVSAGLSSAPAKGGVSKASMDYMEAVHLVTGKVFELGATINGTETSLQMTVSLNSKLTRSSNLVDLLSVGGELRTFKERWMGWRSGELRFWKDIILGADLIDNELRVGVHDETGTWLAARENDASNKMSAILTGKRSVGTAAGIYVLHVNTARKLEATIGGKLSDFNTRQKVFQRTYALLILVVDPDRDAVTIYHRGIAKVNDLPITEFVKTRGKDNTEMSDIIKLFLNGSAPTL